MVLSLKVEALIYENRGFLPLYETSLTPKNLLLLTLITNMSLRKLRSIYGKCGEDGKQGAVYSATQMPVFPSVYAASAREKVGRW